MSQSKEGTDKQIALLQQLAHSFTSIPFNKLLGLKLVALDHQYVSMSFDMKDDLVGNYMQGILHGGVISSVLDMAGGMVTMAQVVHKNMGKPDHELLQTLGKTGTIDLHINYIRPGRGTHFTAKAYLVRSGTHVTFTRMELLNNEDILIATASGTYWVK